MFTRMTPYICGMYVAKRYLEGGQYASKMLEMAAMLGVIITSVLGATPTLGEFYLPPAFNTIQTCVGR